MRIRLLTAIVALGPLMLHAAEPVDYLREVKPILAGRCFSCHSALRQKSELRLDTADLIRKGGELGPAIVPGKSGESTLIHAVTGTEGMTRMPPEEDGAALEADQIAVLRRWIDEGAEAPANDKPLEVPRNHWAFKPPVRPALPELHSPADIRNPIDVFLAAEHKRLGLAPLAAAANEALLRRVYLDLIGIPPTREELEDYVDKLSPSPRPPVSASLQKDAETRRRGDTEKAYLSIVDRLLASPQYGERWGRHWMDVWRYSDWYGRRRENDVRNSYPHIWRWRDWIVRSLNADKGYDRMVMEMLAADELAPQDDATIAATGFIVRNWYSLNYDQWMRDLVEHTGKAFLALRLNCALCHDHKYDPITQEEHFRFRAFFEPLELRQDRVPGGPPLAKYVRYKAGSGASLKPITAGLARVYEETLDAQTYMYRGGDARQRVEGKPPVTPGTPAVLGGTLPAIEEVHFADEAWYPGLKPWAQHEEMALSETAIPAATAELDMARREWGAQAPLLESAAQLAQFELEYWQQQTREGESPAETELQAAEQKLFVATDKLALAELSVKVAEAKLSQAQAERAAVIARIAADNVKFHRSAGDFEKLAAMAGHAERLATLAAARAAELTAEKGLVETRLKAIDNAKAHAAVAKAEQVLTAAKDALAKASKATEKPGTNYAPLGPTYHPKSTGRRKALAAWIVGRDNPLAARVAVNHVWLRHFGRPLVASVYDFGRSGGLPTHPDLLDWLAVELMEHDWSLKHLHRLIVTSAAYQRSSEAGTSPNLAIDKENLHWWRAERRRMEAEVVRDSLLSIAGQLDTTLGGPELDNSLAMTSRRRGLYFTIYPEDGGSSALASAFDAPDPSDCYRRTETLMPQQALALVNSELAIEMSRLAAHRIEQELSAEEASSGHRRARFVEIAFEQVLSRRPRGAEASACLEFLEKQVALYKTSTTRAADNLEQRAKESLVRALVSHHDWITIH